MTRRFTVRASLGFGVIPIAVAITFAQSSPSTRAQADAAYVEGRYEDCGKLYVEALGSISGGSGSAYNAACCFALSGDVDGAFRYLGEAIDRGYRDTDWLQRDSDLKTLQADERWSTVAARCEAAEADYLSSINTEVYHLYQADQADRGGDRENTDWSQVLQRDAERRARVHEMLAADELVAADDFFHAAMVLQHGADTTDFRLAHELSLKAAELDSTHASARWLAAAAWDRYLWHSERPQWYGTQRQLIEGQWTMEPIDSTAATDAERLAAGVPTLAASRARVAQMNAPPPQP